MSRDTSTYDDWSILVSINSDIDQLNDKIILCFWGSKHRLYSYDTIDNKYVGLYQGECVTPSPTNEYLYIV